MTGVDSLGLVSTGLTIVTASTGTILVHPGMTGGFQDMTGGLSG